MTIPTQASLLRGPPPPEAPILDEREAGFSELRIGSRGYVGIISSEMD